MIMRYGLLISTAIILLIVSFNCKSPTAPKGNNPPDTTSSNFTFQAFTFGNTAAGSSYLNDVAIINDTDIWAVGAVYLTDSTGKPDPNAYNAIHWDGSKWELKKVQFYTFCGQQSMGSYPANAVLSLGDSVIWIASINSQIAVMNGDKQTNIMCLPVSVSKIWATNNNEVYTVGTNGQIGYYQSGIWQKIESGTTLPIQNIYGSVDSHGIQQILCVASDKYTNEGSKLLQIKDNTVTALPDSGLPWSLSSVWFMSNGKYYIAGDGLFETSSLGSAWAQVSGLPQIYSDAIRGEGYNDIVVSGSNGTLSHFNGIRWTNYINNPLPYITGRLVSANIKGNIIVAVGFSGDNAYLVMGKR